MARWRTSSGETSTSSRASAPSAAARKSGSTAASSWSLSPLDVLTQLRQRFELADGARELVVELGSAFSLISLIVASRGSPSP